MADLVVVDEIGYKRRNPWGVFLLSLMTFGVYYLVWWYKINNEMKNFEVQNDPAVAVLAVTLGWFILVPPFVSHYKTSARILEAQTRTNASERVAPVLVLILLILGLGAFAHVYMQSQLNKAWDALVAEGAAVLPA